jgi:hypothetical protein
MTSKVQVKLLINGREDLTEIEKKTLRKLLDQNVVSLDSMIENGELVDTTLLRLVISDNEGKVLFILFKYLPHCILTFNK